MKFKIGVIVFIVLVLAFAVFLFARTSYFSSLITGNYNAAFKYRLDSGGGGGGGACQFQVYCKNSFVVTVAQTDCRLIDYPCASGKVCVGGACVLSDEDGDGLSNDFEVQHGLNRSSVDSDKDGFPDGQEDPDLDRFSTLQELSVGTDPFNAISRPSIWDRPRVIVHAGDYIDTANMSDPLKWDEYVNASLRLAELGFTHAGLEIWSKDLNPVVTRNRLAELRSKGLKIAVNDIPLKETIDKPYKLDLNNHTTNGENLKYFGAYGFNSSDCSACNCTKFPYRSSADPGYNGSVWQEELNLIKGIVEISDFQQGDLITLDQEIWGPFTSDVTRCYPNAFNDGGRYSGSQNEKLAKYHINWEQRGMEIRKIVKNTTTPPFMLFYNEGLPSINDLRGTSMPFGTGDSFNPAFYRIPNLGALKLDLGLTCNNNYAAFNCSRKNERNFSDGYVWTSITHVKRNGIYLEEPLDLKVVQTAGKLLYDEGVKGIVIWPGIDIFKIRGEYMSDPNFYKQSKALIDGFNGLSPGNLTEICGDDIDNDADTFCDEPAAGCIGQARVAIARACNRASLGRSAPESRPHGSPRPRPVDWPG